MTPYPKGANDVKQKKSLLALLLCIVLFAGAVVVSTVFSPDSLDGESGSPIVLSEILAGNRTYPAPNGQFLDFVEVHNTTSTPIDISGYMLGVNPFDQPGVEAYKKNMFALLGKPGYEERRAELEARL